MTANGWLQILICIAIVIALTKPVGLFMTHVFNGERTCLHPVLRPVERLGEPRVNVLELNLDLDNRYPMKE